MFLNDCDHILCIVDFLWVKKNHKIHFTWKRICRQVENTLNVSVSNSGNCNYLNSTGFVHKEGNNTLISSQKLLQINCLYKQHIVKII